MTSKILDNVVAVAVLSVFVAIIAFLGSIVGFMFTENVLFITIAQYSMVAIFWTVIGALVIGPICTGFRGV